MSVWDLTIMNWESLTATRDQAGNALMAAQRVFYRGWNEAHLKVLASSLDHTKDRLVEEENANSNRNELLSLDQCSWDEWLKTVRELVEKAFGDVFEIAMNGKRELYLQPAELALVSSISFAKSALIECEGHPFGDFFSVFFAGHIQDRSERTFASLREEFKGSITVQVLDSYDDSVITLVRRGWNPPVSESGTRADEPCTAVSTAPASELPKLEELHPTSARCAEPHDD